MKKEYGELKRKHDLPSFESLDDEFQIGEIEGNHILFEVRKKIVEKVDVYAKFLEDLLQPDTSPSSFYECTILNSDLEKREVFNLYKKLMIMDRFSLETGLLSSDDAEAAFINESFVEWSGVKGDLLKLISLVKGAWEKEDVYTKFEGEYLG